MIVHLFFDVPTYVNLAKIKNREIPRLKIEYQK